MESRAAGPWPDAPADPRDGLMATVPAVILAGGLARRMGGGDKALLALAGPPLLAHVIDRLAPQCAPLALNANGDPARFQGFGLPVIADGRDDFAGPLAGILAAMGWAAALGHQAVLTAPADSPFLPVDLAARLQAAAEPDRPVIAAAPDAQGQMRHHPVFGLWPVTLRDSLARALDAGQRRLMGWAAEQGAITAAWPQTDPDPFWNINTPADLAEAEAMLRSGR